MGLLLIIFITYAVIRAHRHRRLRMSARWPWGTNMCGKKSAWEGQKYAPWDWRNYVNNEWQKASGDDKSDQRARRLARRAERYARRAEKYDKHAAKFEREAGLLPPDIEEKKFATYEERMAYRKARRQASREAGFYGHLMVYATTIGFLFLINLMTTSYPWFLWPAIGWGFGLMSHYLGVYGWRYVQTHVFEPAVAREVHKEVLHEKEVLHTEKQASIDELTATFAHEIRNPIAAAKSLVQQMGEDPTSHENVEYAKVALDELARVERSVSHLLKYAKEEDYNFANTNLAVVLDSALTQLRSKLETNHVTVSRSYLGGPMIRGDADKLRQVFSNIVDNAIDSMNGVTGERKLELAILTSKSVGNATVRIADNGCGIASDKIAKIFNPFYTSKSSGTGLGMAVAKKIIEAHRGVIDVHSDLGRGTVFDVGIPLADSIRIDDEVVGTTDTQAAAQNNNASNGTRPTAPATTPIAPKYTQNQQYKS